MDSDQLKASDDPSFDFLLGQVMAGDPGAIDTWFRAEHGPVWRLCFGFCAAEAAADELAQDALLHLIDRLNKRDPERPYGPWRNSLVLNLCRDARRRSETRQRHELRAASDRPERALPDPGDMASQREVRRVLVETLQQLPAREREAFVLRDLEDQSTEDVADAMGITSSSVRSLLTLARRRLRALLDPRLDPTSTLPFKSTPEGDVQEESCGWS